MRTLFRFLVAFLVIALGVGVAASFFDVKFSHADYWDFHGVLFLISIAVFPRLTLLLSSVATGGLAWWMGWIFAPRILVAVLATLAYWQQNPILVVLAWLVAFGGESSEKYVVVQRSRGRGFDSAKWVKAEKVE